MENDDFSFKYVILYLRIEVTHCLTINSQSGNGTMVDRFWKKHIWNLII